MAIPRPLSRPRLARMSRSAAVPQRMAGMPLRQAKQKQTPSTRLATALPLVRGTSSPTNSTSDPAPALGTATDRPHAGHSTTPPASESNASKRRPQSHPTAIDMGRLRSAREGFEW